MKFSNCGQTCGQRRFLTSYRRGGKCCHPNSPRGFQVFRGLRPEPGPHAPKASALPTALHPDMKFSNCGQTCGQRRFLTSYRRGGKVLSAQLSQGFPGFPRATARTWASRSQSKRATNCATPGYEIFQLWPNMGSTPGQPIAGGKRPPVRASRRLSGRSKSINRTAGRGR